MGAPDSGMEATERPTAETLLTALRTIKSAERLKHENVLDYWLSIRGDKDFPPLHDLDTLQISDAGPCSILLELIGGGQDAQIRHVGEALKEDVAAERIIDAPSPSILSCIAKKLPIVAISRDFLAFEDSFKTPDGQTRCWVTLLPLSSCGSWVDYVYAFVTVETGGGKAAKAPKPDEVADAPPEVAAVEETVAEEVVAEGVEAPDLPAVEPEIAEDVVPFAPEDHDEAQAEELAEPAQAEVEPVEAAEVSPEPEPETVQEVVEAVDSVEVSPEPELEEPAEEVTAPVEAVEVSPEPVAEEPAEAPTARVVPGFAKLLDGVAGLVGFYGQSVKFEPVAEPEPPVSEPQAVEPSETETPSAEAPVEMEEAAPPIEPSDPEPVTMETPVEETAVEETMIETPAEEVAPEAAPEPAQPLEATLQSKLSDVRAKADEARMARLRATAALHEGLSAAYDFAIDAEASPEEYLRLVEAQGLKIQLRAPMAPVVKLAFDGLTDAGTIAELETVLAWALKEELPRGALAEKIEQAGGLSQLAGQVTRPN